MNLILYVINVWYLILYQGQYLRLPTLSSVFCYQKPTSLLQSPYLTPVTASRALSHLAIAASSLWPAPNPGLMPVSTVATRGPSWSPSPVSLSRPSSDWWSTEPRPGPDSTISRSHKTPLSFFFCWIQVLLEEAYCTVAKFIS